MSRTKKTVINEAEIPCTVVVIASGTNGRGISDAFHALIDNLAWNADDRLAHITKDHHLVHVVVDIGPCNIIVTAGCSSSEELDDAIAFVDDQYHTPMFWFLELPNDQPFIDESTQNLTSWFHETLQLPTLDPTTLSHKVESFLTERNISLKGDFVDKSKPMGIQYRYNQFPEG